MGPTGFDQAKNGHVYRNLIYNNSAKDNPGEGRQYDQDGLYCDGCTNVIFERNTVYGNDLGIEATSENESEVGSNVIIRNNLVYANNSNGISVGGYAKTGTGGSTDITIVNNSLYDNDTQGTGSGEFPDPVSIDRYPVREQHRLRRRAGSVHSRLRAGQWRHRQLQRVLHHQQEHDV